MEIIRVDSWQQFENEISNIQAKNATNRWLSSTLLFRGQANADWDLETTLERAGKHEMSFAEYYKLICVLQPEIETFTNNHWDNPDYSTYRTKFKSYDFLHLDENLGTSVYGYMAHLRHHGFPSPLLDWSRSPYVAAHFAFAGGQNYDEVAIHVFTASQAHSGSGGTPQMISFGPRVKTHKRHFLQQCEYTLCAVHKENEWYFSEHAPAFEDWDETEEFPTNFTIKKLVLPRALRLEVLKMLDRYNVNAFSLFGSEESLMDTLALRELSLSED